jgi:hypothetical protein
VEGNWGKGGLRGGTFVRHGGRGGGIRKAVDMDLRTLAVIPY